MRDVSFASDHTTIRRFGFALQKHVGGVLGLVAQHLARVLQVPVAHLLPDFA